MLIELSTFFTKEEKALLTKFKDVDVKLCVQSDKLLYGSLSEGKTYTLTIKNPRRIIRVGGLYLLEISDELNEWHMGQRESDSTYIFWGNYGDLATALDSL